MNISIFGLGYVGCVSMGCLASLNFRVIGVDTNNKKIDLINKGESAILEPGLGHLIRKGFSRGLIKATDDFINAVKESEITFVCIGTPGNKNGNLNIHSLLNALRQISEGIKNKNSFHTIVIRSTVNPGSFKKFVSTVEKFSGKKHLKDYCIIINPEFLREGTAVQDFLNPPINIIGSGSKKGVNLLKKIYSNNKAPVRVVSEEIAEMIKIVSNSFHGIKISFANEVGNICKKFGIDSNLLMQIFCEDRKLNISSVYMKPGFAFGGSCLPKDISALKKIANAKKLKIPLISSAKISNSLQIKNAVKMVEEFGEKKISIWGLSFKIGTDDMRGSPIIEVINILLKKGYNVKVYDQNIDLEKIVGSNKEFVNKNFKKLKNVLVKDFKILLNHSEIMVVNSYDKNLVKEIKRNENKIILDLLYTPELVNLKGYNGICW
jgi:GDP-mannose 6-dehydrogenase